MRVIYVPMFRTTVGYTVSFGRRWSLLEQLILIELTHASRTVDEIAQSAMMPNRLVVEALINLMRTSWVEMRSADGKVLFTATLVGKRRSADEDLPVELRRDIKWTALCFDRVREGWFRAEDLDLVFERDIPDGAHKITPLRDTFSPNDGQIRSLLRLRPDESLEPNPLTFRTASSPFARVEVSLGKVERGMPAYTSSELRSVLVSEANNLVEESSESSRGPVAKTISEVREDIDASNIVVGGQEHLILLKECISGARKHLIIHSCFVSAQTVEKLKNDLEVAARRGVKIEILWGLNYDPESEEVPHKIKDAIAVIDKLPASVRKNISFSPISSGSHAKVIIYDDINNGNWVSVVSSCNFLSSDFDWVEASYRSKNPKLAQLLLSYLISHQLPAAGGWSAVARRLNQIWGTMNKAAQSPEASEGSHVLSLLVDGDHYGCITDARDACEDSVSLGCDLYGVAAETSVLVPFEALAAVGKRGTISFNRPSKGLVADGRPPDDQKIRARGIQLARYPDLHAKYLVRDDVFLSISSFNWLATVVSGSRSEALEIGVSISGPDAVRIFREKMLINGVVV